MLMIIYLLALVLLLLLNAFFVLAEFAVVKVRPTQIDALAAHGNRRAKQVQYIQNHMVEFLPVFQVGITLASIGLGFVGEPAIAKLLIPLVKSLGGGAISTAMAHGIAITLSYILISYLHIVLGELIPKSVAIRTTERSALYIAYPVIFFRYLFIVPIYFLNISVNAILRPFKMPPFGSRQSHTDDEIRIILGQSQTLGLLSFRRLLFIENVLDMGGLKVCNAMHARDQVHCLQCGISRPELDALLAKYRHSRYPLLGNSPDLPLGYIHIKDLYPAMPDPATVPDLKQLVRPCLSARERDPLEQVLSEMQRKGNHLTLVSDDKGRWTGIITMEDAIEEVIGPIEEEFPLEMTLRLTEALAPDRVLLEVTGDNILAATRNALSRIAPAALPSSVNQIMAHIIERENLGSSYVGHRLAIPHARLNGLARPLVIVARLKTPFPAPIPGESVHLLFILLTPTDAPRIHQILLAQIAGIFESDYLELRLNEAHSASDLYNVICTAEQAASTGL